MASSAGATATSSIVNQPFNDHLNGRPSDPFDQEECYASCTLAATRAQSLTVIISQLDMAGMMGMMQVLAARARPIHQVYHGATTWTLPKLDGMTHQEQSDAEVASWNISRVSPWSEQTLPPLALAYKHRTVESGEDKIELKRLRLILTAAAELPGARSFVPSLKRLVKDNYDQRHRVTLPHQCTDELLLWAYDMQCSGCALQIRKQILFRRSCDIGKAQLRFVQVSSQKCIFSMLGVLLPQCKLNMMTFFFPRKLPCGPCDLVSHSE